MATLRISFSVETTDLSDLANGIGTAEFELQVEGYSAYAKDYVQDVALLEFATQLATYPLPAALTLSIGACRIDVIPIDSSGHLRVTGHLEDRDQTATLSFAVEYAALARFKTAIAAVGGTGRCDATLVGEEL